MPGKLKAFSARSRSRFWLLPHPQPTPKSIDWLYLPNERPFCHASALADPIR